MEFDKTKQYMGYALHDVHEDGSPAQEGMVVRSMCGIESDPFHYSPADQAEMLVHEQAEEVVPVEYLGKVSFGRKLPEKNPTDETNEMDRRGYDYWIYRPNN